MKTILKIISVVGLILTLVPSIFVFTQSIGFNSHKNLMLIGTVLWFLCTPFWMRKAEKS